MEPSALAFRPGPYGKPALGPGNGLQFNLSRSHRLALVAVARRAPVGADLEYLDPVQSPMDDVVPFLSRQERQALQGLRPGERQEAFYRCWVRKEAFLKALGIGMSQGFDRFAVSLGRDEARLVWVDPSLSHDRWALKGIEIPGFAAALAVEGRLVRTLHRRWDWRSAFPFKAPA